MASLDHLYAQIPTSEIATQLGVDENEVDGAVHCALGNISGGLLGANK